MCYYLNVHFQGERVNEGSQIKDFKWTVSPVKQVQAYQSVWSNNFSSFMLNFITPESISLGISMCTFFIQRVTSKLACCYHDRS